MTKTESWDFNLMLAWLSSIKASCDISLVVNSEIFVV